MIAVSTIRQLTEEKIADTDLFIVDISVRPGNRIEVLLDRDSGLTVEDCRQVSRHIENALDRETEDFSLDVSSPGVGRPLLVKRQYVKNTGRHIRVEPLEGAPIEGLLEHAGEDDITVLATVLEEVPGKKGRKKMEKSVQIPYDRIREARIEIRFK